MTQQSWEGLIFGLDIHLHHASEDCESRNITMSYFFSTPVDIDIILDEGDSRTNVDTKTEKGRREKAPLYKDGESVKGAVTIRPKDGKRLEHTGIKVQFIGTIGRSSIGWKRKCMVG